MARMTRAQVEAALLHIQSARVELIDLIMRQRHDAPSAPHAPRIMLRLRIVLAYLRLRRRVRSVIHAGWTSVLDG